jgi:hypothetical protein
MKFVAYVWGNGWGPRVPDLVAFAVLIALPVCLFLLIRRWRGQGGKQGTQENHTAHSEDSPEEKR